MNLFIKAVRFCKGCNKEGSVHIPIRKVEAGLVFLQGNGDENPEGWVNPKPWDDQRLAEREYKRGCPEINYEDVFCSSDCMYNYFQA